MKKLIIILLFAFAANLQAQDCSMTVREKKGLTWAYVFANKSKLFTRKEVAFYFKITDSVKSLVIMTSPFLNAYFDDSKLILHFDSVDFSIPENILNNKLTVPVHNKGEYNLYEIPLTDSIINLINGTKLGSFTAYQKGGNKVITTKMKSFQIDDIKRTMECFLDTYK